VEGSLYYLVSSSIVVSSLFALYSARRLVNAKVSLEEEKKKLVKEIIRLKKKNSGVPDYLFCLCGEKVKKDGAFICLDFNSKGEVGSVKLLCPACFKKEKDRYSIVASAGSYAGRLERFFKEFVAPYRYSDKACVEVVGVMRRLLG